MSIRNVFAIIFVFSLSSSCIQSSEFCLNNLPQAIFNHMLSFFTIRQSQTDLSHQMSTFSYKREYINLYLVNKAINKLANTYKDNITLTELFNLCNPSVILPKVITFQMDHFILWHFKESVTSPINYCDLYFTIEKNNDKNRYQLSLLIINCINKLTYNEPFKDYIAAGPTSIEKVTWFINYLKEKVLLTYNNHILESIVDLVNQVDSKFILIQTPTRYEEYEFDGKSPTYLTTYVYRILIDECLNNMSYQKISQLIKN